MVNVPTAPLPKRPRPAARLARLLGSLIDIRVYLHAFRILHFYGYSHVKERRQMTVGPGTGIAPNVSIRFGSLISIGHSCNIGERSCLWAGPKSGRIVIGDNVSLAPEVFITVSDYQFVAGVPFRDQPQVEKDVVIGNDVWLGVRVTVTSGVHIGNGCIVGAGAVVTKDLPDNCIAVGVPARVIGSRPQPSHER
jgi:acetyltransferase-like isoleucine patch superfamily enzyme